MNKIIDCICRNLPTNEVRITLPDLMKDTEFLVIGIDRIDTDLPIVLVKKLDCDSYFDAPYNLIDKIIIIP